MEALKTAIDKAGGQAKLALLIDVKPNVIGNWKLRGQVPEEKCPSIETATGVRCEELRPDVNWQRDETGKVLGHFVPAEKAA